MSSFARRTVTISLVYLLATAPRVSAAFQTMPHKVSVGLQRQNHNHNSRQWLPVPDNGIRQRLPTSSSTTSSGSSTSLNSFMGSDGGLFGIGTPELFTILIVGYFVLGPSDLYKLVKEIGKFIQNVRTLGTEASRTFENTMESQLELQEIRKAQRELNDAFSFRRSINVDEQADAFSAGPVEQEVAAATATAAAATASSASTETDDAPKPRRKKRRRIKKKQPTEEATETAGPTTTTTTTTTMETSGSVTSNIPDLDMSDAVASKKDDWFADDNDDNNKEMKLQSASDMAKEDMEWLSTKESDTTMTPTLEDKDPATAAAEQSRFQQQLSASWNQKVMDNEDELAPLALIMERLAILEEEKAAADKRLEDEFRERFQLEEDFYRKKREMLEESAAQVQQSAYVTMDSPNKK